MNFNGKSKIMDFHGFVIFLHMAGKLTVNPPKLCASLLLSTAPRAVQPGARTEWEIRHLMSIQEGSEDCSEDFSVDCSEDGSARCSEP